MVVAGWDALHQLADINAECGGDPVKRVGRDRGIGLIAEDAAQNADVNLRLFLKPILAIATGFRDLFDLKTNCHAVPLSLVRVILLIAISGCHLLSGGTLLDNRGQVMVSIRYVICGILYTLSLSAITPEWREVGERCTAYSVEHRSTTGIRLALSALLVDRNRKRGERTQIRLSRRASDLRRSLSR